MEYVVAIICDWEKKKVNVSVVEFKGSDESLDQCNELIGCDRVDYIEITLDNDKYDLWCDDEFLLKQEENPGLAWFDQSANAKDPVVILGNAVIAKSNDEGETIGMTYEEASFVAMKYTEYMSENGPKFINWLKKVRAEREAEV